jgi:predicted permease
MSLFRVVRDAIFRRSRLESEMAEELKFHLESRTAELERRGLSPAEAQRTARLEFGSVEGYKEVCREERGFRPLDELQSDLRFAFRTLRRTPGLTAMAVLSLALGIGVNLTVFSSLYYIVLHPFPYPDLDRVMTVNAKTNQSPAQRDPVAPADFLDMKEGNTSFANMAAFEDWETNLTGVDRPDHIQAARVSSGFFETLGTAPLRGRTFDAAEHESGKDAVVVASYGFWKARLASRPDAIGETISLGGRKYTLIGVMPYEFNLPLEAEVWAPLAFTPADKAERAEQRLQVIGRLKPGVSEDRAAAEIDAIAQRLEQKHPKSNENRRAAVISFREVMKTESHRFVMVLTGAALFVLLLACTNVGSLQVARTMGRSREIVLRTAMGANLFRIFRQLMTENTVVGLSGGLVGLALATWDMSIARASIPPAVYRFVPGLRDMRINFETVLLALGLSVAASFLCCLPALYQVLRQSRAQDLNGVLKEGGRITSGSASRNRLRSALVVAEVAIAFVLLVGAGLMVGTFRKMLNVNLGYDPNNVIAGHVSLSGSEYLKPARIFAFYDEAVRKLNDNPAIRAAAVSSDMGAALGFAVEGRPLPRAGEPKPWMHAATSRYLQAMRLPLVSGRWISEQDGPESEPVVVLSASVARHYWPASDPIGQRIRLGNAAAPWLTVVGVAGDENDWFLGSPIPAAYLAFRQAPQTSAQILVRTAHEGREAAGTLRQSVQAIDREQPVYNIRSLREWLEGSTSGVRNAARMMVTYAVIALLLSFTGIYSIGAFFVAQRTHEIGVRMSLGATRPAIMRMVLRQSCAMSGIGLLIGLPMAIILTVGMSQALYNVVSLEPLMFVTVMALLGAIAAIAGFLPANRAARVDPVIALRHE